MSFLYITCKDNEEANNISNHLLKEKLVACTNTLPVESAFWWENKITKEKEILLIAKAPKENYKKIVEETKKIHSYNVPCISLIESKDTEEYKNWMNEVTK